MIGIDILIDVIKAKTSKPSVLIEQMKTSLNRSE